MTRPAVLGNFRFIIEIDKFFSGSFAKASGVASEIEVEEYHEGGNNFSYKFPVKVKHYNVVLQKGVTQSQALYQWFNQVKNGVIKKRDFTISALDAQSNTIRTWNFKNGYPVKWEISDFDAMDKAILIEKLELTHEGVEEA